MSTKPPTEGGRRAFWLRFVEEPWLTKAIVRTVRSLVQRRSATRLKFSGRKLVSGATRSRTRPRVP